MPRILKLRSFQFVLAATATVFLAGCDVDVTEPGEAPTLDVDVQGDPGSAPELDVTAPDVDVQQKEKTIDVPDVDVKTEEKTITVPDVNITVPDENEAGVEE